MLNYRSFDRFQPPDDECCDDCGDILPVDYHITADGRKLCEECYENENSETDN